MTNLRMLEFAFAVLILVASIWLYRRNKAADGGYGSQGAVILLVIAAIVGAHALGAFDYHPTKGELDYMKAHAR